MGAYRFTETAREDLIAIWVYSYDTWGEAQADCYQADLHACCERVAFGHGYTKCVPGMADIKFYHCRHHYLFFVPEDPVVVIAVLHERMDLIRRLRERLE